MPPPLKMAAGSLDRIIVAGGPSSTSPGRAEKATAGSEEFVRLVREGDDQRWWILSVKLPPKNYNTVFLNTVNQTDWSV